MGKSGLIRASDVRVLLQLSHELHELPPSPQLRASHFLERLLPLFDVRTSVLNDVDGFFKTDLEAANLRWWAMSGSFDSTGLDRLSSVVSNDIDTHGPFIKALRTRGRSAVAREEVISDRVWYRSEFFNEFIRHCGTDGLLAAVVPIGLGRRAMLLGLHRPSDGDRFGKRERDLFRIVVDEFSWFLEDLARDATTEVSPTITQVGERLGHPSSNASPQIMLLSPQLQRTLSFLVSGLTEKESALRMGLSRHTIHGYVKSLYRRFAVRSRAELAATVLAQNEGPAGGALRAAREAC